MDQGISMQTVDYDKLIYADVRQFLLGLVGGNVVRGRQNNAPLPQDVIVMQNINDVSVNQGYDDGGNVSETLTRCIQLDFFGTNASAKARQVATMWKTPYACDALKQCQPLYTGIMRNVQFVNEKQLFEDRCILEVYLQFTAVYEYNVETTDQVYIKDISRWH